MYILSEKNIPFIMGLRILVRRRIAALQLLALSKPIAKILSRHWNSSISLNTNLKIISASYEYSTRKANNLLFKNHVPMLVSSMTQ
jgi:hypothetical protein